MRKLTIADCRLKICGRAHFLRIRKASCALSQALGKTALSFDKLWNEVCVDLFDTAHGSFLVRFATANRQSAIFNRKFR